MEKIDFKNLPDETTPINAENLNKFQDNMEKAVDEKLSTVDTRLEEKITQYDNSINNFKFAGNQAIGDFDEESTQKLNDIQQQVDNTIEEMKNIVNVSKIENLENQVNTINDNMIIYSTCTEEELQAAIEASD